MSDSLVGMTYLIAGLLYLCTGFYGISPDTTIDRSSIGLCVSQALLLLVSSALSLWQVVVGGGVIVLLAWLYLNSLTATFVLFCNWEEGWRRKILSSLVCVSVVAQLVFVLTDLTVRPLNELPSLGWPDWSRGLTVVHSSDSGV